MRNVSIAIALTMAVIFGCTAVAAAGPCKGDLTYGFFYAKSRGGGYLEYINVINNTSAKALTFRMHIWGIRAPDSAKASVQTFMVGPGGSVEAGVAYSRSQYFGEYLQRRFDTTATNNFPTLSLTDCI